MIFGDEEHRKIGKDINYGLLYGKSVESVLNDLYRDNTIEISREELREKLIKFVEPINILKNNLAEEYKANECIKNYFHRTIVPEEEYKCLNNYIQSTAADFLIRKILKIQDLLEQYSNSNCLLLQNHDSILFNLNLKEVEETQLVECIIEVLESDEDGSTGVVKLNYGKNWEECKS
jgi:DNA polymerase I-like protein with 3'-5' exonuclease and polymerase domains